MISLEDRDVFWALNYVYAEKSLFALPRTNRKFRLIQKALTQKYELVMNIVQ